jgi:iron complex outermembrane receptor protein
VGYLDSKIEKYLQAVAGQGVIDVSDNRALGFAPRWTAQARLAYDFDLADRGSVLVAVDVAYRDQIFTDSPVDTTNAFRMNALSDSLTTWNAQMAFTSRDAKWRVALEGKNLSDEREQVNTFVVSNFMTAGYLRGRTWALSLGYKY